MVVYREEEEPRVPAEDPRTGDLGLLCAMPLYNMFIILKKKAPDFFSSPPPFSLVRSGANCSRRGRYTDEHRRKPGGGVRRLWRVSHPFTPEVMASTFMSANVTTV